MSVIRTRRHLSAEFALQMSPVPMDTEFRLWTQNLDMVVVTVNRSGYDWCAGLPGVYVAVRRALYTVSTLSVYICRHYKWLLQTTGKLYLIYPVAIAPLHHHPFCHIHNTPMNQAGKTHPLQHTPDEIMVHTYCIQSYCRTHSVAHNCI